MKTKHTPGPWKRGFTLQGKRAILGPSHQTPPKVIAIIGNGNLIEYDPTIDDLNANLITAAPELLEAAKLVDCNCTISERVSGHRTGCWFPTLDTAITKAEGK